jgi:hypothetical protein
MNSQYAPVDTSDIESPPISALDTDTFKTIGKKDRYRDMRFNAANFSKGLVASMLVIGLFILITEEVFGSNNDGGHDLQD